jgi:hypothetical protein
VYFIQMHKTDKKRSKTKNRSLFQSSKINPYRTGTDTALPVQLSVLEAEFSLKTPAVITRIDIGKLSIRYIDSWRFLCTVPYSAEPSLLNPCVTVPYIVDFRFRHRNHRRQENKTVVFSLKRRLSLKPQLSLKPLVVT